MYIQCPIFDTAENPYKFIIQSSDSYFYSHVITMNIPSIFNSFLKPLKFLEYVVKERTPKDKTFFSGPYQPLQGHFKK